MDSEFARPLIGLFCLGMIWLAFQLGLLAWVGEALMAPLAPKGPTNAGEIYREQLAEEAAEEAKP